MTQEVTYLAR